MIKLFLFVYVVFLCNLFVEVENKFRIDLVRMRSPREIIHKYEEQFPWIKPKPHPPQNNSNVTIAIYRYLDSEFYGIIKVGSKNKTFNVVFDTAWSTSWLISKFCPVLMKGCMHHNQYDHSKSLTYTATNETYFVNEGFYNLSGFYSKDDMNIAGFKIYQQKFVEMVELPDYYATSKADGVLGMSLPYGNQKNFMSHMLEQGIVRKPIFSIFLSRDRSSIRGGHVTVGYYDKKHIHQHDNITYIQVTGDYGLWEFPMESVALDNGTKSFPVCVTNCKAFLDTSSNAIITSMDQLKIINDLIGATLYKTDRYLVNCDTVLKLPKVDFIINGKPFTLSGKHYIQRVDDAAGQICQSAFMASSVGVEDGRWVLGGAFLSHFYTIYDMKEKTIGIVTAA